MLLADGRLVGKAASINECKLCNVGSLGYKPSTTRLIRFTPSSRRSIDVA